MRLDDLVGRGADPSSSDVDADERAERVPPRAAREGQGQGPVAVLAHDPERARRGRRSGADPLPPERRLDAVGRGWTPLREDVGHGALRARPLAAVRGDARVDRRRGERGRVGARRRVQPRGREGERSTRLRQRRHARAGGRLAAAAERLLEVVSSSGVGPSRRDRVGEGPVRVAVPRVGSREAAVRLRVGRGLGEDRCVLPDRGAARLASRREDARQPEPGAPAARRLAQRRLVLGAGGRARGGVGGEQVRVLDPRLGRGARRERTDILLASVRPATGAGERARVPEPQLGIAGVAGEQRGVPVGGLRRASRLLRGEPREVPRDSFVPGPLRLPAQQLGAGLGVAPAIPEEELQPLVAELPVLRARREEPVVLAQRGVEGRPVAPEQPRQLAAAGRVVVRGEPHPEVPDRVPRPVRVPRPLEEPRLLERDLPVVREAREVAVELRDRAVRLPVRAQLLPERARRLAGSRVRGERLPVRLDRGPVVPDPGVRAAARQVPGVGDARASGRREEQRGREERGAGGADHRSVSDGGAGKRSPYAAR